MLVKQIASAYFFPVQLSLGHVPQTVWINLAQVTEIWDSGEILKIHEADESIRLLHGTARLQLLEELAILRAKQTQI